MCRPVAAGIHRVAEITALFPGLVPGIILFLVIGVSETISTGQICTGVPWVFSEESTPSLQKSIWNPDVNDVHFINKELDQATLNAFAFLKGDARADTDPEAELPTAVQVFIIFGFLAVHHLITFTVFNIVLFTKCIDKDNLIVANIISISAFFLLILAAGDPLPKACLLTAAYFICVATFLSFLLFLVNLQARWFEAAATPVNAAAAAADSPENTPINADFSSTTPVLPVLMAGR
jgi:hypothetical protein